MKNGPECFAVSTVQPSAAPPLSALPQINAKTRPEKFLFFSRFRESFFGQALCPALDRARTAGSVPEPLRRQSHDSLAQCGDEPELHAFGGDLKGLAQSFDRRFKQSIPG